MALKLTFIFLLVAVIMATSIVEAQQISPNRRIGIIYINGTLYCSTNGSSGANGNTNPVFPDATVQVACTEDAIGYKPSNATTNSNGAYRKVLIPRPNATLSSIVSNCRLFVRTPLSSCNPSLPSAGLVSDLRLVRRIIGVLNLNYMVASGFILQT